MNATSSREGHLVELKPKGAQELARIVSTLNQDIRNTQTPSLSLRVRSPLDAAFSPGDWSQVAYHTSGVYHLITNVLGLLGVDSPLPPALVEVLTEKVEKCAATRAVFDAVHTRMIFCLCNGLCKLEFQTHRAGQQWPQKVLSLGGLINSDLVGLTHYQQSLVVAAALRGRRGIATIRWLCHHILTQSGTHPNVEILVDHRPNTPSTSSCRFYLGATALGTTSLGRQQESETVLMLVFRELQTEAIRALRSGPLLRQLAKACHRLIGCPIALSCTFFPAFPRLQPRLGTTHLGHYWVTNSHRPLKPATTFLRPN